MVSAVNEEFVTNYMKNVRENAVRTKSKGS